MTGQELLDILDDLTEDELKCNVFIRTETSCSATHYEPEEVSISRKVSGNEKNKGVIEILAAHTVNCKPIFVKDDSENWPQSRTVHPVGTKS